MFSIEIDKYNWDIEKQSIYSKTATDVEIALFKSNRTIEDFKALVSPAALPYLEQMAQLSRAITQKRFGKTIQLYIPLYLSNECRNVCTYCGFSYTNKIKRKTLTRDELLIEVKYIKSLGFEHVLLVTGEDAVHAHFEYILEAVKLVKPYFSHISIEVQPLDQHEYEALINEGVNTVLVYQETYNRTSYKKYHPKGKKSNYEYRLETPDRLGKAGIYKIGLGILLGLDDWRTDSLFTALHLKYLEKKYWQTKYSVSFPRLRPFSGGIDPVVNISDKELVQLICAWRLFNEEVELSLSTRETEIMRDNLIRLGITSMSAGSKTNPGGYVVDKQSLEQFEISDERSVHDIVKIIKKQGYEPVWKDWDKVYSCNYNVDELQKL